MERASHARSEQQLEIAREEYRANQERNERERQEANTRHKAEEDRTRPRFQIEYLGSAANFDINLENVGLTTARNVKCRNRNEEVLAEASAVKPGAKLFFRAPQKTLEAGFAVKFETDQGSIFEVDLKFGRHSEEEVLSIERGY